MKKFLGHKLSRADVSARRGAVEALEATTSVGHVSFILRTSGGVVASLTTGIHSRVVVIGRLMTRPEQAIGSLECEVRRQHSVLDELLKGCG